MPIELRHDGETVTVRSSRKIVQLKSKSYEIGVITGVLYGGIPYDGSYEVTPTSSGTIMPTKYKSMADDITVHPIPYTETSNEAGGKTISIAS